jgi:hypothetical protein
VLGAMGILFQLLPNSHLDWSPSRPPDTTLGASAVASCPSLAVTSAVPLDASRWLAGSLVLPKGASRLTIRPSLSDAEGTSKIVVGDAIKMACERW